MYPYVVFDNLHGPWRLSCPWSTLFAPNNRPVPWWALVPWWAPAPNNRPVPWWALSTCPLWAL